MKDEECSGVVHKQNTMAVVVVFFCFFVCWPRPTCQLVVADGDACAPVDALICQLHHPDMRVFFFDLPVCVTNNVWQTSYTFTSSLWTVWAWMPTTLFSPVDEHFNHFFVFISIKMQGSPPHIGNNTGMPTDPNTQG